MLNQPKRMTVNSKNHLTSTGEPEVSARRLSPNSKQIRVPNLAKTNDVITPTLIKPFLQVLIQLTVTNKLTLEPMLLRQSIYRAASTVKT